jgi:hypothetical protein
MIEMKTISEEPPSDGGFEIKQQCVNNFMLKLSSWITRHLALFGTDPTEGRVWVSASTIGDLMEKTGCKKLFLYPSNREGQLKSLFDEFCAKKS